MRENIVLEEQFDFLKGILYQVKRDNQKPDNYDSLLNLLKEEVYRVKETGINAGEYLDELLVTKLVYANRYEQSKSKRDFSVFVHYFANALQCEMLRISAELDW